MQETGAWPTPEQGSGPGSDGDQPGSELERRERELERREQMLRQREQALSRAEQERAPAQSSTRSVPLGAENAPGSGVAQPRVARPVVAREAAVLAVDATPAGQRATRTARVAARPRSGGCARVALSLGLALVVILGLVVGGLTYLYFRDWTVPGVQALGMDVGGKTQADVRAIVQQLWQERTITLSDGQKTWTLPPERLGINLDVDATVAAIYAQGRTPASLRSWWEAGGVAAAEPAWSFDRGTADALLRVMAGQLHTPPQNASAKIADGRVETTKAISGRDLDVDATLNWLEDNSRQALDEGQLSLVVVSVQPAVTDVSSAEQRAYELMDTQITLKLYDPITNEHFTWDVPDASVGEWLALRSNPTNPSQLEWIVDAGQVEASLRDDQAAAVGQERYLDVKNIVPEAMKAVEAGGGEIAQRAYHTDRQHTVKAGETLSSIAFDYGVPYTWIQKVNPDLGNGLRSGQTIKIPSQDVMLPLPLVENKRILINLTEQKMWAYENGQVKWEWRVSTGMNSSPTNPGVFQVQTHEPNAYAANWDLWMPNFMGIYRPVPDVDFMNGFHGFPKRGGTQILWTNDLSRRVTYGCILISTENSKLLYDWAEEGTVVEIKK